MSIISYSRDNFYRTLTGPLSTGNSLMSSYMYTTNYWMFSLSAIDVIITTVKEKRFAENENNSLVNLF